MSIFHRSYEDEYLKNLNKIDRSKEILREVKSNDKSELGQTFSVPSFLTDKFTYHRYGIVCIGDDSAYDYSVIGTRVNIPDCIPDNQTVIDVSLFAAANSLATSMINDIIDNSDKYDRNYNDEDNSIYKLEKAQIDGKDVYMIYVAFYDEGDRYTCEFNFIVFEIE